MPRISRWQIVRTTLRQVYEVTLSSSNTSMTSPALPLNTHSHCQTIACAVSTGEERKVSDFIMRRYLQSICVPDHPVEKRSKAFAASPIHQQEGIQLFPSNCAELAGESLFSPFTFPACRAGHRAFGSKLPPEMF
jgi:hypothetical protein